MNHFRALHFRANHFAANQFSGVVSTGDLHDGGYYYRHWKRLHKKKQPELADVIEIIQENPEQAIKAIPEVKKHFDDVSYKTVKNNLMVGEFIATQILVKIQAIKRDEDEEDDFIEMLLLS